MREVPRIEKPLEGDERSIVRGWLAYHRAALAAKCHGLSAEQLVARALPPSTLCLLGLVRHLTEMEHSRLGWALGPDKPLQWVWGEYTDDGPAWDFDADASMVAGSFAAWERAMHAGDALLDRYDSLDQKGTGNGRTLRWNLLSLIYEYGRHLGHADLLRERIDGQTGE